MLKRSAATLGIAGGLFGIAATVLVLTVPFYTSAAITSDLNVPAVVRRETLLQVGLDPRAAVFLGGMTFVAIFGLVAANSLRKEENRVLARVALWFCALVVTAGSVLSMVGLFYAPAALLLLLSAILIAFSDSLRLWSRRSLR